MAARATAAAESRWPPPAEDAEKFNKLEISGQQEILQASLRLIEPELKKISVVALGGIPVLYGEIGIGQMLKLPYRGDGMARFYSLVLAIGNTRDGVVLMDEIENAFHHTVCHAKSLEGYCWGCQASGFIIYIFIRISTQQLPSISFSI